jgi:uncharacterized protein (DUF1684 family)
VGDLGEHVSGKREQFLAGHPESLRPPEKRGDAFPGLNHYDPGPAYRFVVPLHTYSDTGTVTVGPLRKESRRISSEASSGSNLMARC